MQRHPDEPILRFLAARQGVWCNWYYEGDDRNVSKAMQAGTPDKLILAKLRRLNWRGLIDGRTCGCRGDFVITPAGLDWLARHDCKLVMPAFAT